MIRLVIVLRIMNRQVHLETFSKLNFFFIFSLFSHELDLPGLSTPSSTKKKDSSRRKSGIIENLKKAENKRVRSKSLRSQLDEVFEAVDGTEGITTTQEILSEPQKKEKVDEKSMAKRRGRVMSDAPRRIVKDSPSVPDKSSAATVDILFADDMKLKDEHQRDTKEQRHEKRSSMTKSLPSLEVMNPDAETNTTENPTSTKPRILASSDCTEQKKSKERSRSRSRSSSRETGSEGDGAATLTRSLSEERPKPQRIREHRKMQSLGNDPSTTDK